METFQDPGSTAQSLKPSEKLESSAVGDRCSVVFDHVFVALLGVPAIKHNRGAGTATAVRCGSASPGAADFPARVAPAKTRLATATIRLWTTSARLRRQHQAAALSVTCG